MQNVNFFQRGGGVNPKVYIKKVCNQWKYALKWISLKQECILLSSESVRNLLRPPIFCCWFFSLGDPNCGGDGYNNNNKDNNENNKINGNKMEWINMKK